MSLSENFLGEVQIFVTALGITESVLGSRSVGDSDVIGRLRRGQSITLRTADRIYDYMAAERLRRAEAGARRSTAAADNPIPDPGRWGAWFARWWRWLG